MNLLTKVLLAAAAAVTSTAAFAQADPRISVSLTPINDEVTLARAASSNRDPALTTFAAYEFTISNSSTNQLNRLYLRNAVAVATTSMGPIPVIWDSVNGIDPSLCTGFGTNTLNCDTSLSVGPDQSQKLFIAVARAPTVGTEIVVNYSGGGFEGSGIGNGCCANAGTAAITTLVDSNNDNKINNSARSYLKRATNPSLLFTGDRYIAKPGDRGTTAVSVPTAVLPPSPLEDSYAIGKIEEESAQVVDPSFATTCTTAGRLKDCLSTKLSIVNGRTPPQIINFTPSFLEVTLRIDESNINPGTTVDRVRIYYYDDATPTTPTEIFQCTTPVTYPCLIDRREYRGGNREFRGDFEWIIRSDKNGRYVLF